jgi:hypothetical protein
VNHPFFFLLFFKHIKKYPMNTNFVKAFVFIAIILNSTISYAQDGALLINRNTGSFFIAILAGIILAFAFQFLLANLALALGVSAIGDIREMSHKRSSNPEDSASDDKDSTPTGVKVSTGAGIFMLVTLSLSLFFASLIAVKLSLLSSNYIGFSLGMVIWAGTLLLGVYLDSKLISALTGTIFGAIKETLSAGASTVGDVFSSSEKSRVKSTAQETVKAIHKEIRQEYDLSGFQKKLDEYINKLEPQRFDIDNLHEHIAELLHEIEIKEQYTPKDPEATKRLFLEVAERKKGLSQKDKEKLKGAFDQAKEVMKREGSRADKAMAIVDKLTPGSEEEGREYREKVEQYLRRTNREELNPDSLKEDLNKILNSPKAAPAVVQARASQIDRSTIKAVLSTNGVEEEKAEQYLSKAEEVLTQIKSTTKETQKTISSGKNEFQQDTREQFIGRQEKAERAIEHWFNRMEQPELRYERLRQDVERMMDDPKAAPQILRSRLKRLDRDSLIALLSNNKRINHEQAEKVVVKIEEARDSVIRKTEEIEQRVRIKMNEMKEEVLKQAEATRKTAATAAWWFFIAAVVSGAASALGGILAFTF